MVRRQVILHGRTALCDVTEKTVRGTIKIWDSSGAGIAMLWAKRAGRAAFERFLDVIYPPFWRRELDIDDFAALETTLREAGIDTEGFRNFFENEGRAEHDRINESAFESGIFGRTDVPRRRRAVVRREHLRGSNGSCRGEWVLRRTSRIGASLEQPSDRPVSKASEEGTDGGSSHVLLGIRNPFAYLALAPAADGPPGSLAAPGRRTEARARAARPSASTLTDARFTPQAADPTGPRGRSRCPPSSSPRHAIAPGNRYLRPRRGAHLREYYRTPDPTPFVVSWLFLRETSPERLFGFLRRGIRRYWCLEFDPSSEADVERLVDDHSADRVTFEALEGARADLAWDTLQDALANRGIARGPCYVLDDEIFVGRRHLAMIEWRLLGEVGDRPI